MAAAAAAALICMAMVPWFAADSELYREALLDEGTVDSELEPLEASPGDTGLELKPSGDDADDTAIVLLPAELDITEQRVVLAAGGDGLRTPLDIGRRGSTPPPPPLLLMPLPPTLLFPRDSGDDGMGA